MSASQCKTLLNECAQTFQALPIYVGHRSAGSQWWATCKLIVLGVQLSFEGAGAGKKEAEGEAARLMLAALDARYPGVVGGGGHTAGGSGGSSGAVLPAAVSPAADYASHYISLLNEFCQRRRLPPPVYANAGRAGSDHAPVWYATCSLAIWGKQVSFKGGATTLREAEGKAARQMLEALEEEGLADASEPAGGGPMAAAIRQGLPGAEAGDTQKTKTTASWPDNYLPSDADLRTALAEWLGGSSGGGTPSAGLLLALRTALVHPSCGPHNYERLAFYGDTVLRARAAARRRQKTTTSRSPAALSHFSHAQLN
jgi:dsRNA-specific ribonuclease